VVVLATAVVPEHVEDVDAWLLASAGEAFAIRGG